MSGDKAPYPVFKTCTGLMSALFAYSALLQWNDPDPARWIAAYAVASMLSLAPLLRPIPGTSVLSLALIAIGWALSLLPGIFAALAFTGTEQEREFCGLMIVGGWMLFLFARSNRERRELRIAQRRQLHAGNPAADEVREHRSQ